MNDEAKSTWPTREAERKEPEQDHWLNRLSQRVHHNLIKGVSNLRLSLTLRIALHYAGQLLRTTIPVLAAILLALWLSQLPDVFGEMDRISKLVPSEGLSYSRTQLLNSDFSEAYYLSDRIPDTLGGVFQRLRFAFSRFPENGSYFLLLSFNTVKGCLVAVWPVDMLVKTSRILIWTFLAAELYRMLAFLRHRNRLNRKVLKPITDMAEKATTLSANNLSDRISVEGAKNELKDLALVINGMLDRIEISYNSQKQFVSDASHELRTPIAVIQGYAGMLERWGKTDKAVLDEGIAAISQEAKSMKELVERLLFLARHDKKTLMLEMEVFDPLEVMSEIHREAKLLSSDHLFRFEAADHMQINGDKDMIKQLMRILLDNAIKYTPPGGKITLGLRREFGNCVLSVSDTGSGISAEDLPRIFERFYRCDDARKGTASGHGLGLSIARIIVSAHQGKLKVRSKLGTGTTFSVQIPLENE